VLIFGSCRIERAVNKLNPKAYGSMPVRRARVAEAASTDSPLWLSAQKCPRVGIVSDYRFKGRCLTCWWPTRSRVVTWSC
jgi:hypothetical protein